jgi:hypothetical protein
MGDAELKSTDGGGYWVISQLIKLDTLIEFSEILPAEYTDLTSVEFLDKLNFKNFDYHFVRRHMIDLVAEIGFNNLLAEEKVIAARYCAADATTLVGYFMGFGLAVHEAVAKYKVYRSIDITSAAEALSKRADNAVVKYIAVKYMSEAEASAFSDAIRNFITDLRESAHLGLNYNQARDGIMDYIEATGSYVDGGLKSYTFENGYTYDECKEEFKNYIVYGIKPTEFDVLSPA